MNKRAEDAADEAEDEVNSIMDDLNDADYVDALELLIENLQQRVDIKKDEMEAEGE